MCKYSWCVTSRNSATNSWCSFNIQGFTAETRTLLEETGGTKIQHLPLHQSHVLLQPGQKLCFSNIYVLNTLCERLAWWGLICCTKKEVLQTGQTQEEVSNIPNRCPTSQMSNRQFFQWPQQDHLGLLWPSHALHGTSWRLVQASWGVTYGQKRGVSLPWKFSHRKLPVWW